MIILSHSGKQHSYHTALAMYKLGKLERFYTSSYVRSSFLQKQIEKKPENILSRRYIKGLPGSLVSANWRFEIPEMVLRKIHGKSASVQKYVYLRDTHFDQYIANKIQKINPEQSKNLNFWGFQGSCHDSLEAANKKGIKSICELSTAHVVSARRILGEEAKLHPEWAGSIDNLVFPAEYEKRLVEEPHIAKRVVAASAFTRESLLEAGIESEKIDVLPLGCDTEHIYYAENPDDRIASRPLRLLFAGTVTQRKGIKYLLEAMRKIMPGKDIELHIIGGVQGSDEALRNYKGLYNYHGAVSQQELFRTFREYDALVLPTIFEGFGLVIVEAMAAGLPVITTPHSMGPEVISEGKNGYIVPVRDIDVLANAIISLREKTDEAFLDMRKSARQAALGYSWEGYAERMKIILDQEFKMQIANSKIQMF